MLARLQRARSWWPSIVTFILTIGLLLPSAVSLPQHGDEAQYGWTANYFTQKLLHLDFSTTGTDPINDPGWDPASPWTLTQPMGARFIYGLAIAFVHLPVPLHPYIFYAPPIAEPDTLLAGSTLLALRLLAIFCAAIGLGLMSWRLNWSGTAAALIFLAIPHVRDDLAHAWGEGPLLLGLGLAVATYGSVWFGLAAGLAASFKLTALVLWPAAYLSPRGKSPILRSAALLESLLIWMLLTPSSWFLGGPFYLIPMLFNRLRDNAATSISAPGETLAGIFFPSRYLWPFELVLAVLVVRGGLWILQHRTHLIQRPV